VRINDFAHVELRGWSRRQPLVGDEALGAARRFASLPPRKGERASACAIVDGSFAPAAGNAEGTSDAPSRIRSTERVAEASPQFKLGLEDRITEISLNRTISS
jgi:hypothetical protein